MTYDQWKTDSGYSERDPEGSIEGCICQHVGYCDGSCQHPAPQTARARLAVLIGGFQLHTDDRGDENQVLQDAFSGDYEARTEAVYQLVDDVLAEVSAGMTPTQPTHTTTEVSEAMVDAFAAEFYSVRTPVKWTDSQRKDIRRALEAALSTAPSGDGIPGMVLDRLYALASQINADGTASQIGSADEILEIAGLIASSTGKETP